MSASIGNPVASPDAGAGQDPGTGPEGHAASRPNGHAAIYAAAGLSFLPALAHLWMMPAHFAQWWGYGSFYLAAAAGQGLLALALLRWPRQGLYLAGLWTNVAVLLVYLATRTSGTPVGPHAGIAEEASLLDMVATTAEVGLVVVLATMLRDRARAYTINALLLLGAALWASRLLGLFP